VPPLQGDARGGTLYNFTCTVMKTDRSDTTTGFLSFSLSFPPTVVVDNSLAAGRVNFAEKVVLAGNVSSVSPVSLRIVWSQLRGPPLDLGSAKARTLLCSVRARRFAAC
jgi:hypothetical protein